MSNEKICAIVLTYNREQILKECVEALVGLHDERLNILVVDNNSSDGTKELLASYGEDIVYINTGKNLGGAGGFNFGIKEAIKQDYDYLWIMDDDAIVTEDALNELIKACKYLDDDFGFLASNVRWTDGTHCLMNIPGFLPKELFVNMDMVNRGLFPAKHASFVSFFVKTDTVKAVGFPIKDFFIWGDDAEYSKRICKYNSRCYFVSNSIVLHKMAQNNGINWKNETNIGRIDRYRLWRRNEMYITRKYSSKIEVFKEFVGDTILQYEALFSANCGKRKFMKIMQGKWQGLFFNPDVEEYGSDIER